MIGYRPFAVKVLLGIASWTAIGCIFALPGIGASRDWTRPLLLSLGQWWSWGLLAPLIIAIDRRLPLSEKQLAKRLCIHLPLSFVLTAFYFYVLAAVFAALGFGAWHALLEAGTALGPQRGMFLWSWLVYWLLTGAWQSYQYHRRYLLGQVQLERLERKFAEARLHALRMQLDPHFLFNALNTISSQVERNPRLARAMIERLGQLLRLSLETRDKQEIPLAEEMSFLQHYLAIQSIRFGDRLRIETRISPEVRFAAVPSLLLQPLVENAIRHGISSRASGGSVTVSAQNALGRLQILVSDNGVGLPQGWTLEDCAGFGLSITRDRITGLHAARSSFAVRPRSTGGTEVEILLPLRVIGEDTDGDS